MNTRLLRSVSLRALLAVLCIAALAAPAWAQDVLDVSVQVDSSDLPQVTLYVSVTDAAGQPVTDLAEENFSVTEAGQPVTINDFAGIGEERPADIVFVFDTTGSMHDEIAGLKRSCTHFAQELQRRGRDYRLGLVTFWDDVREVFPASGGLTEDVAEFSAWIDQIAIVNGAGDDAPENDYGALQRAASLPFRDRAQVIFILITDAPPHVYGDPPDSGVSFDDPNLELDPTVDILTRQGITVYAVASNAVPFAALAARTGGRYYDLEAEEDFTDIIDTIGQTLATQYRIGFQTVRPHPDGTVRDVQVTVHEASGAQGGGSAEYLEEHLVNIHSHPLVAVAMLLPLLGLLVVPAVVRALLPRRQPVAVGSPPSHSPPPSYAPPPYAPSVPRQPTAPMPPPAATVTCPHCARPLRASARFCPSCGHSLAAVPTICTTCGAPLRPGAQFCGRCGRPVLPANPGR